MTDEWQRTTFSNLISAGLLEIGDGYRAKNEELGGSGHIFLRAGHVTDACIDVQGAERFHAQFAERFSSKMSKSGDTVVTTKGNSTGRASYVTSDLPEFVYSPHLCYWRSLAPQRLAPQFLRYWARSTEFKHQLRGMQASTDMAPYLSLTDQRQLTITLPPAEQQVTLGRMLGALDDKIHLNRRTNETLEAMARVLFKSWFVDFDPVRARSAGRTPSGMDAETAELFPSEFDDSDLGHIPKAWPTGQLGDVIELKRGYDLPSARRRPGLVPIVSSSGTSGLHDEAKVKAPGVVTGRYGTIGKVFFVGEDFWPLNTTLYVRDFKGSDVLYAYHLLRLTDFGKYSDKGAVPGINRNQLHEDRVVVPPATVQRRFGQLAGEWLAQQVKNQQQSDTLVELRDALLPRLLSGQLSIGKAERFAGAVT